MMARKGIESLIPMVTKSQSAEYYRMRRQLRRLSDDERRILDRRVSDMLEVLRRLGA